MVSRDIVENLKRRRCNNGDLSYNILTYNLCEAFKVLYYVGLITVEEFSMYIDFVEAIERDLILRFGNNLLI